MPENHLGMTTGWNTLGSCSDLLGSRILAQRKRSIAMLDGEITRQATTIAYIDDFKLMMIVALLAVPMVLLLRKPSRQRAGGTTSPAIVE